MLPGRTKLGWINIPVEELRDSVPHGPWMRWSGDDDPLRSLPCSQPIPAEVSFPKSLNNHQLFRDATAGHDGKRTPVRSPCQGFTLISTGKALRSIVLRSDVSIGVQIAQPG